MLRERGKEFSLIHAQGLRAGTEAALANIGHRVPLLITLHDVIVPQNDVPGRFKWLKKRLCGTLTRRATVIIPVSGDCETNHMEQFPEWKKGPCRIEPIVNGIDVDGLLGSRKRSERDWRSELGLAADCVLGGFFGRFMPQKGFLPLLEALRGLHREGLAGRFHLIATRDDYGMRGEYVGEVLRNPELAEMITFVPPVADIAPLLTRIDVLCMPSLWEACGLLAMEAMVLGVPVLGSDCLGLREVLRGTPALVATAGDADSIFRNLRRFLENPAPFQRSARDYAPRARERFDMRPAVARLGNLYESIGK